MIDIDCHDLPSLPSLHSGWVHDIHHSIELVRFAESRLLPGKIKAWTFHASTVIALFPIRYHAINLMSCAKSAFCFPRDFPLRRASRAPFMLTACRLYVDHSIEFVCCAIFASFLPEAIKVGEHCATIVPTMLVPAKVARCSSAARFRRHSRHGKLMQLLICAHNKTPSQHTPLHERGHNKHHKCLSDIASA